VELTDGRVGTEEMMAAKGMAGDHEGVAGDHEAGLSHARWTRTKRARVPESDFNALRGAPLADTIKCGGGRQPGW
jgi:hypothetical protein